MENHDNSPNKRQRQDRDSVLKSIRKMVESETDKTLLQLKKMYPEDVLFQLGLKYVTTTKKAYCEAMLIPIEAGCRYKRDLEKSGLLMQSVEDIICPFTKYPAKEISTNPEEFERLSETNQLSLF